MAKYYIQSGQVSFCVIAADVEGAALWAMHRVIDGMIQTYEQQQIPRMLDETFSHDAEYSDENAQDGDDAQDLVSDDFEIRMFEPMLDGLACFDREIKCSQIGFGREDAGTLRTDEIFVQWRQLMRAADHLFDHLN